MLTLAPEAESCIGAMGQEEYWYYLAAFEIQKHCLDTSDIALSTSDVLNSVQLFLTCVPTARLSSWMG